MVNYYLITFIIALICLVAMLCTYEMNQVNFFILASMVLSVLSNAGYLLIALSHNVNEAVIAKKNNLPWRLL